MNQKMGKNKKKKKKTVKIKRKEVKKTVQETEAPSSVYVCPACNREYDNLESMLACFESDLFSGK